MESTELRRASLPPFALTDLTDCGGCAAKLGADVLAEVLAGLGAGAARTARGTADADLIAGLDPPDDAAVYRLTDDVAVIGTVDFFPPLVDDPATFGAIAAANACSDVFAMGGRVLFALSIAAFPEDLPTDVMAAIVGGAAEVVREAGGTLAGGHTIRDPEPKFGLAVMGVAHPGPPAAQGRRAAGRRPAADEAARDRAPRVGGAPGSRPARPTSRSRSPPCGPSTALPPTCSWRPGFAPRPT